MAQIFHYGPYAEISADGALGPGEEDYWFLGRGIGTLSL
jgi:hypothetical protein